METIFKTTLLIVLTVLLLNCKKEVTESTNPSWQYDTFTDSRDGKTYNTIQIGNQLWMAENLAYKTTSGSWARTDAEISSNPNYGRLYTWESAIQAIPAGWHLPTDSEWKELEMSLGMNQSDADGIDGRGTNEGNKLKASSGWAEKGNGTNEVGFTALPGGFRTNSGDNYLDRWIGYWWSATEKDNLNAWFRFIATSNPLVYRKYGYKGDAYSVRCVKNK